MHQYSVAGKSGWKFMQISITDVQKMCKLTNSNWTPLSAISLLLTTSLWMICKSEENEKKLQKWSSINTWKTWILSGFFAAQCWPSCSLQQQVQVVVQQMQYVMKTTKFVQLSVCYQRDYVDTWLLQMGFNMVWYRADQTQINICFWKDYNMTISLVKPADTGLFRLLGKIMFHIKLVTTWVGFLFDMV